MIVFFVGLLLVVMVSIEYNTHVVKYTTKGNDIYIAFP